MKTAAAYIRVSTDDQLEYSPDSQLKAIREYAASHGMVLPEKYIFQEDDGVSGRKAKKRREFLRMIGTAKKKPKPFDFILLWKFSRFDRSRVDSVLYKSLLRKQLGIEVISVSEPLGDDKMSVLVEAMIEAMDEYYSINLAEEVRRGMREKVSRGEPVTPPAFGYRMEGKKYAADPDTAPLVAMIFRDFASGMGYGSIAAKLNAMGVRTKRGSPWESRTVAYLLQNPVYIGKIRWSQNATGPKGPESVVTNGTHSPLIDEDLWQQVQKRISEKKRPSEKGRNRETALSFSLQGLVRCSDCGSTLTRAGSGALQCEGYAHGKCAVSHSIRIQKLEEMVFAALENTLTVSDLCLAPIPKAKDNWEAELLKKQAEREWQKLRRIRDAYESGADSLEEYRSSKQKITARIQELEAKKASADCPAHPRDELPAHAALLEILRDPMGDVKEKNLLLRAMLDRIVYNSTEKKISLFFSSP